MQSNNSTFLYYLCLTIYATTQLGHAATPKTISSYRNFLANLSACDLQIFHSWDYDSHMTFPDLGLVSTIIFMPKYANVPLFFPESTELPGMDIFKSRFSPCRLCFIFLSPKSYSSSALFEFQAGGWIQIAAMSHLYYHVINYRPLIPSTNALITVVINKSEFKHLALSKFGQPMFHYLVVVVVSRGEDFEMCFPTLTTILIDVIWENIKCMREIELTEGNYPRAVEMYRSKREEWCLDDTQITPDTINTAPLGKNILSVSGVARIGSWGGGSAKKIHITQINGPF
ncbi:hypothetical protein Fcan01_27856 [Folsomia candida]|uniref:Uncharacterized protein n=1 Tax=Folsomia candida TaxID=158441 RepID=A0A226CY64_FOLCA|nr:hypothetical protein Fcan01_27856 [Folsomia candida]